jgi:flagellar basal-body rod modification protein FlgD
MSTSAITTFATNTKDPNDLSTGTEKLRAHKSTLDQNDFLKLLTTKMSAQDPMNPQADTDFIAQMAQFSSLEASKSQLEASKSQLEATKAQLEQAKAQAADMASLRGQQELLTANELIGREVILNDGKNSGVVASVAVKDGAPVVMVDGKRYTLDEISNISPYVLA